jgi:hypothetical protein
MNYMTYLHQKSQNSAIIDTIGYCSILIKYKYIMLKIEKGEYNTQIAEYGKKVYQNMTQFGKYADNIYFQSYMKEILLKGKVDIISQNTRDNKNVINNHIKSTITVSTNEKVIEKIKEEPKQQQEPIKNVYNILIIIYSKIKEELHL